MSIVDLHVRMSEVPTGRESPGVRGQSVRLQGRLHSFAPLTFIYGEAFISTLLDSFTAAFHSSNQKTTEKRSAQLRRWLTDLAQRAKLPALKKTPVKSIFDAFCANASAGLSSTAFADGVNDFVSRLNELTDISIVKSDKGITRRAIVENLSSTLAVLAKQGLFPHISPLAFRGSYRQQGNNIEALCGLVKSVGTVSGCVVKPGGLTYESAQFLNSERLKRVRQICESSLIDHYNRFRVGQNLFSRNDLPSSIQLQDAICAIETCKSDRTSVQRRLIRKCFPEKDPTLARAGLLKHIVINVNGKLDYWNSSSSFRTLVDQHGGPKDLRLELEGTIASLVATMGIILVDTGMNVQPCQDLSSDPFIGTARHGRITLAVISATKKRAAYKPTSNVLLEGEAYLKLNEFKISTTSAIKMWLEMSGPIRKRAKQEGAGLEKKLLIIPSTLTNSGPIKQPDHAQIRDWWLKLLEDHKDDPVIGGLPIRFRHLRPTWIQLQSDDFGGDARLAAMTASHADAATTMRHYLNRPYMQQRLDEKMRHFSNLWEASLCAEPLERAAQLDIDEVLFAQRVEEAVESGLGFLCSDPLAGEQPGSVVGQTCAQLERCADCRLMRFSDTLSAMRGAVILYLSMERAWEEFFARNPERWTFVWLPLHALATAVCEKLSEGFRGAKFAAVRDQVKGQIDSGDITLFQPW